MDNQYLQFQKQLNDQNSLLKAELFDPTSHPIILRYTKRHSPWSNASGNTMLMKPYLSHLHGRNDVTHGTLLFSRSKCSHTFVTIPEHCILTHGNKPCRMPSDTKSINYHEDPIPSVFLKTCNALQQHPHLDYHHDKLAST